MVDAGRSPRGFVDGPDAGRRVFVDPRFACVVRAFASMFPGAGSVAERWRVYLDGQPVVDMWKGWANRAGWVPWSADSASVRPRHDGHSRHRLTDRGPDRLSSVAEYWPSVWRQQQEPLTKFVIDLVACRLRGATARLSVAS